MDENQTAPELKSAIEEARAVAREQVAAAWQLQVDRIREQLETGWRDQLDRIFEERFAEIESRLLHSYTSAVSDGTRRGLRDVTDDLNQTARRLRGSESREEWIRTLIEAAQAFCGRPALVVVTPKGLRIADHPAVPVASAPAFGSAIESKDTVVAVGTPRELSQPLSTLLGNPSAKKVYLFPVVVRQDVAAVLYAEPGDSPVDVSGLELLTALAAASVEATETVVVKTPGADLIRISGGTSPLPGPSWSELPKSEQEIHLRAQRFARTRVAELLLHKVRQVRSGRETGNLYGTLREEIEAGRDAFRREFIESCPSMVDYFHLELQRTLAKDNHGALGSEYPGPLPVGASAR